jgi:hypothetical protein
MLGLPPVAFSNRRILEIGPGGGYNSIVYFLWGADVDFVEPNPVAQKELSALFGNYGIAEAKWNLYPLRIEEFKPPVKYDIVIAEGFLAGIKNRGEVLTSIKNCVKDGGVAVVTCEDDISHFFEFLKRIIAFRLLQVMDVAEFEDRVKLLSSAFASHLNYLVHSSRPVEDWVTDVLLNPSMYGEPFSIGDCISEFGDEFNFLGSSPSMFTNLSWYKDTGYDERKTLLDQFSRKRHLLLSHKLEVSERDPDDNGTLIEKAGRFRSFIETTENNLTESSLQTVVQILEDIKTVAGNIDRTIELAIDEGISLLLDKNLTAEAISEASNLGQGFGRGLQYVSMVRKIK